MAKKKMTVSTRNVIEYCDNQVSSVRSFPHTEQGEKEAEKLSRQIATENGFKPSEIDEGVSEGTLSSPDSDYQVFLISSQD